MTAAPFTAVGLVIKTELAARGLRAKDLAARIGIRQAYLSAVMHGHEALSLDVALGIERALGLDAAELVRLDGERHLKARLTALARRREALARHAEAAE